MFNYYLLGRLREKTLLGITKTKFLKAIKKNSKEWFQKNLVEVKSFLLTSQESRMNNFAPQSRIHTIFRKGKVTSSSLLSVNGIVGQ